jgi:hypothetical protein
MQFPTAATLILLGAISLASASLTLSKRQALSQVNVYSDTSCSNYMTTVSTSGSGAGNGECFTFGSRVFGADTTELTGGCDGMLCFSLPYPLFPFSPFGELVLVSNVDGL